MPNADIFFCKFHCVQTFNRKIKNKELLPILDRLLNCDTVQQYQTAYDDLMKSLDLRDNQYLQDNWLCEKYINMWIKYKRIGKITLDSDTNNSVETINRLLKEFIKKKTSLAKNVVGIFRMVEFLSKKYAEKEWNQRTKIIIDRSAKNDPFIEQIYRKFTPYAADIVKEAYNLANKAVYKIEYNEPNAALISSKNSSTVYDYLNNPQCDCFDFGSTLLPCRHVIFIRKTSKVQIIVEKMINQRWANRLYVNPVNEFQTP
ncbi:zinc finger SWIM domain-containing 1-like, partial [Brachionus plicatilis]